MSDSWWLMMIHDWCLMFYDRKLKVFKWWLIDDCWILIGDRWLIIDDHGRLHHHLICWWNGWMVLNPSSRQRQRVFLPRKRALRDAQTLQPRNGEGKSCSGDGDLNGGDWGRVSWRQKPSSEQNPIWALLMLFSCGKKRWEADQEKIWRWYVDIGWTWPLMLSSGFSWTACLAQPPTSLTWRRRASTTEFTSIASSPTLWSSLDVPMLGTVALHAAFRCL